MQKKDTGRIYAMKTLMKSEMFKKDQVRIFVLLPARRSRFHRQSSEDKGLTLVGFSRSLCSSLTSEPNETSWPSPTRPGSSPSTSVSKIRSISTSSWSSCPEEIS